MPLARLDIEQIEIHRWHAEIEAGGLPGGPGFRRVALNAETYDGIIAAVTEAYRGLMPQPALDVAPDPPDETPRLALLAYADERGIEVDRRWGIERLRAALMPDPIL